MPDDIRRLAHDIFACPDYVQVDHAAPASTVSHALYPVDQHLKTALLLELASSYRYRVCSDLTRTKHRAKRIGQQLERAGYRAASLQGNLSRTAARKRSTDSAAANTQILVATDIAARGIDVSSISHVINYDMPDTADAYTHRIGRTGKSSEDR